MTPTWRATAALGLALADLAAAAVMFLPGLSTTSGRGAAFAGVLAAHLVFALATGALLADATPHFVRHTSREVALFASLMTVFVPVLAPLGVLCVLRFGLRPRRARRRDPWLLLERPSDLDTRTRKKKVSPAEVAETLRSLGSEHAGRRFSALLATRRLPAKLAVPLLRSAQSDPSDEVRLYAFSRLEHMRGDLEKRIEQLTTSLVHVSTDEAPRLHLRLAESYWELGYAGLAEGAVLEHALDSARHHATVACELLPEHAPAEFFLGRVLVHLREAAKAKAAFTRAIAAGYPRHKVLPYLAECAFHRRDFAAVRLLLRELAGSSRESVLFRPVMELWGARRAPQLEHAE